MHDSTIAEPSTFVREARVGVSQVALTSDVSVHSPLFHVEHAAAPPRPMFHVKRRAQAVAAQIGDDQAHCGGSIRCWQSGSVGYFALDVAAVRSSLEGQCDSPMTLLLAAVGATVTALLELTVGPYLRVGTAEPHLVLVLGIVVTVAIGLEAGLVWAFVGGLVLDVLAQRPLGSTSFALLLCVAAASVLARLLARIRPVVPIIATFLLSAVYSMILFVAFNALVAPIPVDDPIALDPPRRRLRHHPRGAHRTPRRSRSTTVAATRNGWTGDGLPRRPSEAHQVTVSVPRLRSHRHPGGQRTDGSPVLPPDRRWRPSRHARHEEPDHARPGRLTARPHLRPQRPDPGHERPDVRREAAAGRPPDRATAGRRRPAGRTARHRPRRTSTRRSTATPDRPSTSSGSPTTSTQHGPPHLRGRDRLAGRRGRRRGATAIHATGR